MWYPNGDGDGDGNRIFTYLYIYHIFPISTGDISLLPIFHPGTKFNRTSKRSEILWVSKALVASSKSITAGLPLMEAERGEGCERVDGRTGHRCLDV